jgi:hypothetical protein
VLKFSFGIGSSRVSEVRLRKDIVTQGKLARSTPL